MVRKWPDQTLSFTRTLESCVPIMVQELVDDVIPNAERQVLKGLALQASIHLLPCLSDPFWRSSDKRHSIATARMQVVGHRFWVEAVKPYLSVLLPDKLEYDFNLFSRELPPFEMPLRSPFKDLLLERAGQDWFENMTHYCLEHYQRTLPADTPTGFLRLGIQKQLVLEAMKHFEGFVFAP